MKVIVLFAGIVFFVVGIVMIYQVVGVGGVIDVYAAAISGKVEKGSAGLIIMFFATTIIISSLAFGTVDEHGQRKKISSFLWGITLFVIAMASLVLTASKSYEGWGMLAVLLASIFVVLFVIIGATQFLQDQ
ncbi:MAG: hypothetical protein K8F62_07270 [Pseudorhodoplanes sp.]|nr:hypothetical protein [Pseudorhodoplanes sp.]